MGPELRKTKYVKLFQNLFLVEVSFYQIFSNLIEVRNRFLVIMDNLPISYQLYWLSCQDLVKIWQKTWLLG